MHRLSPRTGIRPLLACGALSVLLLPAAIHSSTPSFLLYTGRLLNNERAPVTTPVTMRFSLWKSADSIDGDATASGTINTGALQYGGWVETQTLTPDAQGGISVKLGSVTALPTFAIESHRYLQVEVKASDSSDTAYELMDPTGDNGTDDNDRQYIASVPYAKVSESLQGRMPGTASGSVALLGSGGLLSHGLIPGGTDRDQFTIDIDDSASESVALQFGTALSKRLSYDIANSRFTFNDDLRIEGDLTVTGRIDAGTLTISNAISASGSVVIEGTLSGATIAGFGLPDCDAATNKLLYDLTTKTFSCASDSGTTVSRIQGASGAAGADVTWQNLTADSSNCTTTTLCSAAMTTTGLGTGIWKFTYTVIYQTAATNTGIGFGINHTGSASQFQAHWRHVTTGNNAATGVGDSATSNEDGQIMEGKHGGTLNAVIGSTSAGVDTANADILAVIEGVIVVTGNGNLELKLVSERDGTAVRIMAGSTVELMKIQ